MLNCLRVISLKNGIGIYYGKSHFKKSLKKVSLRSSQNPFRVQNDSWCSVAWKSIFSRSWKRNRFDTKTSYYEYLTKRDVVRKTASFVKRSPCGTGLPHLKKGDIWSINPLERKKSDEVMIPLMKGTPWTFVAFTPRKVGGQKRFCFLQIFDNRHCPQTMLGHIVPMQWCF